MVAGTALADVLLGPDGWEGDPYTTFAYTWELEGHPDNASGGVRRLAETVHVGGVDGVAALAVEPQPRAGQFADHVEERRETLGQGGRQHRPPRP